MHSRPDRLPSSCSNFVLPFPGFPSLHARAEQLARQREQLSAAREAVRLAGVRYREGLVTYLDVLDTQRTTLAAETQLVLTERTRLTDMVSLFKALGGGWVPSPTRNPA